MSQYDSRYDAPITPITGSGGSGNIPRETMVDPSRQSDRYNQGGAGRPRTKTVVLGGNEEPALGWLVIRSGPYRDQQLPLKNGVTLIGRDGLVNDHVVDDDAISGRHLSIRFKDGTFLATDLDTANGTTVNGKPIGYRVPLKLNDIVVIGTTRLAFLQLKDEDPTTSSQP